MPGAPVARIYADIDLNYEPYTRAQKKLLKDVTTSVSNIEKSYVDLGIKSSRQYDLMRAKIMESNRRIVNDSKATANDVVRANKAMAEQLKRIDTEQFGARTSLLTSFKNNWIGVTAAITAGYLAINKAASYASDFVKKASDLQEVTSKFNTVFADQQRLAESWTEALVSGYAMSTREAKQYLSSVQDLLVPMGMQAESAARMSNEVVKLSADLGSFNNQPTAKVMDDIQSALVGNYETMKKYGVVLNATTVQQEAMNMGLAYTKDKLTAADKAQASYALIVRGSSAAIGDMARTSDGWANSIKALNAAIEDFKAKIGTAITESSKWKGVVSDLKNLFSDNGFIDGLADTAVGLANIAGSMASIAKYAGLRSISETFTEGADLAQQGFFEFDDFKYATFMDRQQMVDDALKRKKMTVSTLTEEIENNSDAMIDWDKTFTDLLDSAKPAVITVEDFGNASAASKTALDRLKASIINFKSELDVIGRLDLSGNLDAVTFGLPDQDFGLLDSFKDMTSGFGQYAKSLGIDIGENITEGFVLTSDHFTKEQVKAAEKAANEQQKTHDRMLENIQNATANVFRDIASGQIRTMEDMWDRIKNYAFDVLSQIAAKAVINLAFNGSSGLTSTEKYTGMVGGAFAAGYGITTLLMNAFGMGYKNEVVGPLVTNSSWQPGNAYPWNDLGEWHQQQGGYMSGYGATAEAMLDQAVTDALDWWTEGVGGLPEKFVNDFKDKINSSTFQFDLTGLTFDFNSEEALNISYGAIKSAINQDVSDVMQGILQETLDSVASYLGGLELSMLSENSSLISNLNKFASQNSSGDWYNKGDIFEFFTSAGEFITEFESTMSKWSSVINSFDSSIISYITGPLTSYESAMSNISKITQDALKSANELGISESELTKIRQAELNAVSATDLRFAESRIGVQEDVGEWMLDYFDLLTPIQIEQGRVNDQFDAWRDTLIDLGATEGQLNNLEQQRTAALDHANDVIAESTDAIEMFGDTLQDRLTLDSLQKSLLGYSTTDIRLSQISSRYGWSNKGLTNDDGSYNWMAIAQSLGDINLTADMLQSIADRTGMSIDDVVSDIDWLNDHISELGERARDSAQQMADAWDSISSGLGETILGMRIDNAYFPYGGAKASNIMGIISEYTGGGSLSDYLSGLTGGQTQTAVEDLTGLFNRYFQAIGNYYPYASSEYETGYNQTMNALVTLKQYADDMVSEYEIQASQLSVLEEIRDNTAALNQMNSYDSGGYIDRNQIAFLHAGETVNRPGESNDQYIFNISGVQNPDDFKNQVERIVIPMFQRGKLRVAAQRAASGR